MGEFVLAFCQIWLPRSTGNCAYHLISERGKGCPSSCKLSAEHGPELLVDRHVLGTCLWSKKLRWTQVPAAVSRSNVGNTLNIVFPSEETYFLQNLIPQVALNQQAERKLRICALTVVFTPPAVPCAVGTSPFMCQSGKNN